MCHLRYKREVLFSARLLGGDVMRDWVQEKKKWRLRPAGVSARVYHKPLLTVCVAFLWKDTCQHDMQVLPVVSKCLFHLSFFFDC